MALFGADRQPKLRLPYFDGSAAPRRGFSYFRQPLKSADAYAAPTDEYAMIESGRAPGSTGRTHIMKKRDFIIAGLAGLILAALPCSVIKAAPLSGALEAAGGTNVILVAHRHGRRPSARLACADVTADWPYYFHEFYCPDGHPHPVGFYGGKAFYFGGVW
jgi:hypothetical protein